MVLRRLLTRRVVAIVAGLAVLLGAGAFVWVRSTGSSVRYRTAAATLGTVTQTVSLSGNLEPLASDDATFATSGRVQSVDVAVGQPVVAGSVLATLDPTSLQAALTTAQANLTSAQARLQEDENPTAQSLESAQAQVNSAEVSLQNAQTSLSDTESANALAVQQATTTLQNDEQQESSDCNSSNSSAQANCSKDEQQVQQDRAQLQAAQQKQQQSNDQAEGQVASARVQLENAQSALAALRQGATAAQIAIDQSQVEVDQVGVTTAQQQLDDATLTAPVAGVVAAVNLTVGQEVSAGSGGGSSGSGSTGQSAASGSSGSTGASASSGSDDILVLTPGEFEVTGSVSDAVVNQIAVNQPANVIPAGSEEAVTGHVSQIAQEATISSGVATFPVTVTLDGSDPSLRAGMSASVSVVVNQVVQVLTVPTSAVHTTAAGSTVQVLVNGAPQVRSVQVGASDALRTQILSGLNAGDTVVIATISSSVPSSTSGSSLFGGRGGFAGGGGGGGFAGRAATGG